MIVRARLKLSRPGWGALTALAAATLALLGSALAAAPALALPEGRVYELVSPVYKGGYGANSIVAVAPDGESVAFGSLGAFAGDPANNVVRNLYVARRGVAGWSTAALTAPAALVGVSVVEDFSATLESSLSYDNLGPNRGEAAFEGTEEEFLLHSTALPDEAANFEVAGEVLTHLDSKTIAINYRGASPEFSNILFEYDEPLLKEAVGTESVLYDLTSRGAGGEPVLQLVGLNDKGKVLDPECRPETGGAAVKSSDFNAVAADGGEIFFTPTSCSKNEQLYVRLGGARTLEVSRPLSPVCGEVPCAGVEARAPAVFQGASEDGSKVFFTTTAPLVPADTDSGNDLYMAKIECPGGGEACALAAREVTSLVQVSHDPSAGESAEVQGVTVVASDGSRVYFVARGVLGGANAEGRAPLRGADNLYAYDSAAEGSPVFVGDLCSGPEESGVMEDAHCPAGLPRGETGGNDSPLWGPSQEAQVNGCSGASPSCEPGRFLVFSTYAQLTGGDTDTAKDVYRYDAVTGLLDRVSVGEGGYDANGNNDAFGATISEETKIYHEVYQQQDMNIRAVSEDGSRIVFTSAAPLSRDAAEGILNAYEWHIQPGGSEGRVSLVSTGSSAVSDVVISDSGKDILFTTTQGLVPQDTDGQSDVYDARLEGGFPSSPAPPRECEGDACQGPLTNPAPLLVPGSVSQAPGGNFAAPAAPAPAKTATPKRATPKKCAKGKKLTRGKCVKPKTKRKKTRAKKASGERRGD